MPFQNQFRLKIGKSKRHTEHYSRLTQNPVQTERAPTIHYTPNLYTEHVIINSNVLLFLELKTTFEESVTTSGLFFESLFFLRCHFVSIIVGEESGEKGVSLQICGSFLICRGKNKQSKNEPFPPSPLSLHLFFPFAVKVLQYFKLPQIIL